jgi:hypothetical protein
MAAHDWDSVGAAVTDDVVRIGPYRDTYRGRDAYVEFLRGVLPGLPGYVMHVDRVFETDHGAVVVELREIVDVNGAPLETHEALVFDLAADGRIARIAVYVQTAG